MNRTDQAPEPTMEEILASIRLIISDDAKKGPSGRDDHPIRSAPPRPETAPLNSLPEEEVLDLTEALVFPEDQSSPGAPASRNERQAKPAVASDEDAAEAHPPAQQDAVAEEPEATQAADMPPQPEEEAPQDFSPPMPQASRTIWSRREIPASPPPAAPAAPRYEAPGRHPQRNWAQDVQMPIPDRGPVSLMPDQMQTQVQERQDAGQAAAWEEPESDADMPQSFGEKGEAAVAAIAESLARSAAGAMNSDELETAGDVDFSKLGEEQKAEVTETFASAIQRENASHDKRALPTLLDEVFRKDFVRQQSPAVEPADDLSEPEGSDGDEGHNEKADEERFGSRWGAPAMAAPVTASPQPVKPVPSESPARAAQEKPPVKAASPRDAEPARPGASRSPLEDAVRDMLQPLLLQWLNEHMPRILEKAIREEVATRGLSSKTEK
jgi:cell pole-organizing protein PopZ